MKCKECGKTVPNNAVKCPHCGQTLATGISPDIVAIKEKETRHWTIDDSFSFVGIGLSVFSGFTLSLPGLVFSLLSFRSSRYRWASILGTALGAVGICLWVTMIVLLSNHII